MQFFFFWGGGGQTKTIMVFLKNWPIGENNHKEQLNYL